MKHFILPEKWFIKTTSNYEDEIVVNYINETFDKNISVGLDGMSNWYYSNVPVQYLSEISDKHDYGKSHILLENGYEEITFDQFVKYVINKENTIYNQDESYNKILINLLTNG